MCAEKYYCELRRMIRHVVDTMYDILFLGATDLCVMIYFIDATFCSYDDFKSCTGDT